MGGGMIEALKMAKGMQKAPVDEGNVNPSASTSGGDVVYLPSNLTLDGAKKGDKVTISGEVVSTGSKLGIRPNSVEPEGGIQEGVPEQE